MSTSNKAGLAPNVLLAIFFLVSTFSGCFCIPDDLFEPECRIDSHCYEGYSCSAFGACVEIEIPDEEPIVEDPPPWDPPETSLCDIAECVRLTDCTALGLDYPQCIEGCCEDVPPPDPVLPCSSHLGACEEESQSTLDFVCDTTQDLCLMRCETPGSAGPTLGCPLGSVCFEGPINEEEPELSGVCFPGDCTGSFDEHECGEQAHCLPFENGASYCFAAGELSEGESCTETAEQCGPGLFCLNSRCVPLCTVGEGCDDDAECLQVFDITPANQPGYCGVACTPHSAGECGESMACVPAAGRGEVLQWFCQNLPDAPAGADATCDPLVGCVEGYQCGRRTEDDAYRCIEYCDALGEQGPDGDCSGVDAVCVPSQIDGIAHCLQGCDPYPRRTMDYGCEGGGSTCVPFVSRGDVPVAVEGFCSVDGGTASPGEPCSNPGFAGGDCLDQGACGDFNADGDSICAPLCDPFGDAGSCDGEESACSGIPPLVGSVELSYCVDTQPGGIGDQCVDEGFPCRVDGSICLDFGGGPTCHAVCREGFDDCEDHGGACITGELNPDVVPGFMGLCR